MAPAGFEVLAGACRPIDFVAAGITGVLSHHRSGFDAYHVVNPHWDDGVSLDAIVGWVDEDRGGLRRIQDYSQWCVDPASPALCANMAGFRALFHLSLMPVALCFCTSVWKQFVHWCEVLSAKADIVSP